jgi:catecholate siderophore receptor
MPRRICSGKKVPSPLAHQAIAATKYSASSVTLLPLGAMLLAGSLGAMAQTATDGGKTLPTVTVTERAEAPEGKDSVRATEVTIGKGKQLLRDVPQSVTVITEKVMDDRNLDTLKEVLATTGGISFQAAEGGEEDIKLRGFSLQGSGDVFVDGMRDPAFYERDTFNFDRIEVMRGSASMLFGRGSTGGAVNMVNKVPRLMDEHQVDVTVGSHSLKRVVGDFNLKTGDSAALRLNAMVNTADNDGAGNRIDKRGIAATYRWGIGEKDEFSAGFSSLENRNGINYGLPWIRPTTRPIHHQPRRLTCQCNHRAAAGPQNLSGHGQRPQPWQRQLPDLQPHAPVRSRQRNRHQSTQRPVRA